MRCTQIVTVIVKEKEVVEPTGIDMLKGLKTAELIVHDAGFGVGASVFPGPVPPPPGPVGDVQ